MYCFIKRKHLSSLTVLENILYCYVDFSQILILEENYKEVVLSKISLLKECYNRATDAAFCVNKSFELQNCCYSLQLLLETSVIIFTMIKRIMGYKQIVELGLMLRLLVLLLSCFFMSSYVITLYVCGKTKSEVYLFTIFFFYYF